MALFSKVRKQFQTLELVPRYFYAIAKEWMNLLFGESLVGVLLLIWWALGNPPLVPIFVLAALVAGYYAWRPLYLFRIPKINIQQFAITPTPTNLSNVFQTYIHIIPECATEAPIEECKGFLLRVLRLSEKDKWESTTIDEPLELLWSIYDDTGPRTLYPGVASRLNVCYVSSHDRELHASVSKLPLRCGAALKARNPHQGHDTFRFDIRLTLKDGPPVDTSVIVKAGGLANWNQPIVNMATPISS
jgi:hypothetical protein